MLGAGPSVGATGDYQFVHLAYTLGRDLLGLVLAPGPPKAPACECHCGGPPAAVVGGECQVLASLLERRIDAEPGRGRIEFSVAVNLGVSALVIGILIGLCLGSCCGPRLRLAPPGGPSKGDGGEGPLGGFLSSGPSGSPGRSGPLGKASGRGVIIQA